MSCRTPRFLFPAAWLIALVLSACGGGGGSSSSSATPAPAASPILLSLPAHGLSAAQLGLVVIDGDAVSEAAAAYYQQARGVPAANIVKVSLPAGTGAALGAADFARIKASVDAAMPAAVQALLLVWRQPSRVAGGSCSMSITSAMALGFDARYCGGCVATAASPYYDSESLQPFTDLKMRPAMMLGTDTLAAAKALIDLGLQADASQPDGTGWLIRTSDADRSVRYLDFLGLPASWSGWLTLNYTDNSGGTPQNDALTGKAGVLFYFTGLAVEPGLATNSYRAGAVGDSLSSSGGALDSADGQTRATDWLAAGLTASFGTVEEPCNYTEKFPRASVMIDHYWRGDSLIEAYWKSVQWPGEGLFVGEPLARPWHDQPSFSIVNGQYQISTRGLRPGAQYWLQYRKSGQTDWTLIQLFTPARGGVQNLSASLAPTDATQLRWLGPCPGDLGSECVLAQSP
ncbi:MAG: TIGR03790 family protein [Paucibacter sp.]|nr:TIGR03790 family protein [Roseateles sp.]